MKFQLAVIDGKRTLYAYQQDVPKGIKTQEIDIDTSKDGLMAAIQELLTEADEAKATLTPDEIRNSNTLEAQTAAKQLMNPSYVDWSVNIDESFTKLSVPHQLHLAEIALENARKAFPEHTA